ncbi:MAG TPA: hypothetical protein VK041_04975 [Opitutales bacterium]|nr:hypothetical protein [Opitutales bacterium]
MNKKARLEMIRKAYYDTRRRKRKLTPKSWQLIKELREENEEVEPDMVFDFNEDDIYEEIELMKGAHVFISDDSDWDNAHYYDSNLSSETLYFRNLRR